MKLKTNKIEYKDEHVVCEGVYVYDEDLTHKRPGILIAHDWSGRNEFAYRKAEKCAELGYVGFALDMYGHGKTADTKEEKMALMQPLMQNRHHLQQRILAAYNAIKTLAHVDHHKIGAIGFCFGGLCVLDLARSGADVKGVVSFHGLLNAPENVAKETIKAKILALHGYDDPMVTPDQVMTFANEMTHAKADWQLMMYGHTMHAFTNPDANDPGFGTVYNKKSDLRSFTAMQAFFKEVF